MITLGKHQNGSSDLDINLGRYNRSLPLVAFPALSLASVGVERVFIVSRFALDAGSCLSNRSRFLDATSNGLQLSSLSSASCFHESSSKDSYPKPIDTRCTVTAPRPHFVPLLDSRQQSLSTSSNLSLSQKLFSPTQAHFLSLAYYLERQRVHYAVFIRCYIFFPGPSSSLSTYAHPLKTHLAHKRPTTHAVLRRKPVGLFEERLQTA